MRLQLIIVSMVQLVKNSYSLLAVNIHSTIKTNRRCNDGEFHFEDISEHERAIQEEKTMNLSIKLIFKEIPNPSALGLIEELNVKGVARMDGLLCAQQTTQLLGVITKQLALSRSQVPDIYLKNNYFGNSKSQENRWDLKLPLCQIVSDAMSTLLCPGSKLGDAIHGMVGSAGSIAELGALITIEGAGRQIIHSDTFWSPVASLYTCTIALQDVDELMGPTVFIPSTHTEDAYLQRVEEFMEADIDKDSKLLDLPHVLSTLNVGDAAVYDSRLLHCGGANRSPRRRVLFYFTIANPNEEDDEGQEIRAALRDEIYDFDGMEGGSDEAGLQVAIRSTSEFKPTRSIRKEVNGFRVSDFRCC